MFSSEELIDDDFFCDCHYSSGYFAKINSGFNRVSCCISSIPWNYIGAGIDVNIFQDKHFLSTQIRQFKK